MSGKSAVASFRASARLIIHAGFRPLADVRGGLVGTCQTLRGGPGPGPGEGSPRTLATAAAKKIAFSVSPRLTTSGTAKCRVVPRVRVGSVRNRASARLPRGRGKRKTPAGP